MDDHNWPAITIDSKGTLHVIANGHQDPANYAHSLRLHDISAWSAPQYLLDPSGEVSALSYATLNCDREDNLYTVVRNSTARSNNRLSLFTKPAGEKWQPPQDLVIPFSYNYKNWGHKMAYNATTDELCLSFYSQSNLRVLYPDTWAFDIFIWPDREKAYHTGKVGGFDINTGAPESQKSGFAFSMSGAMEPTTLIRQCPVGRWKLAVSSDFR